MLFYDVQLAGIAVQGNTAIVHYYFKNERKDAEGKIKKDSLELGTVLINPHPKDLSKSPTFVGFFVCGLNRRPIDLQLIENRRRCVRLIT